MTRLKTYSKADYFKRLIKDIKNCTEADRILIGAMSFDQDEPLVAELFKTIRCHNANRCDFFDHNKENKIFKQKTLG